MPHRFPPGSRLGLLGGGQLGKMTALAAARLGYTCHVFSPLEDSPACQVTPYTTHASYEDREHLMAFARDVDVVTLEFENVPLQTLRDLESHVLVRPGGAVLAVTQDRLKEKAFLNDHDLPTVAWCSVRHRQDLEVAWDTLGAGGIILKTARFGYDGKGQARVSSYEALAYAWEQFGSVPCIAEGAAELSCEISVVVARGQDGSLALYPPVENEHRHHVLYRTHVPATLEASLQEKAIALATQVAQSLQHIGLLAVEMFVVGREVLVNELAPRPHNSGHWTIEACATSQFEQLVRAVCGLPLGSTEVLMPVVMENLLGTEQERWLSLLQTPGARLHIYGKKEALEGRKMGHVTYLTPP